MKTGAIKTALAGVAALIVGGVVPASMPAQAASKAVAKTGCDEACLKGFMDGYLDALAAHDSKRLPVAAKVKFTENGVSIPLGEALWVTVSGLGKYRHYYYDPSTGGVAIHTAITENGTPAYLMVRLKVVGRKLTEIETVVNRSAANAATQAPYDPMWDEVETKGKRLTREELIKATIGYLKVFAFKNGKLAPFAESCIRLENGNVMSLGPNDKPPFPFRPLARDDDWQAALRTTMGMGCVDQVDTGVYSFITEYDNARFDIVDVKRQVVFGVFNFRRRGNVMEVKMPNGRTYPMMPSATYPNEVLNTEGWKFRDGKITRIEAVFLAGKIYKTGTGWPGMKGEHRNN
ncbi:MAG: hypothetical protein ABIO39_01755 [Caulobacteraceae bacterium]